MRKGMDADTRFRLKFVGVLLFAAFILFICDLIR